MNCLKVLELQEPIADLNESNPLYSFPNRLEGFAESIEAL